MVEQVMPRCGVASLCRINYPVEQSYQMFDNWNNSNHRLCINVNNVQHNYQAYCLRKDLTCKNIGNMVHN